MTAAVEPTHGDRLGEIMSKLDAARLEFDAQARRYQAALARLQVTLEQVRNGRSRRQILHASAFARLQARLDTLPVIEQAKGIVMAQRQCGPEAAFDLLRRASQSANVKVSVLAARIVEQAAAGDSRSSADRVNGGARRRTAVRSPQ
jgi:two-component system, response regulator / RNA-binding antiterminator